MKIKKNVLKWLDHAEKMSDERIPKKNYEAREVSEAVGDRG